MGLTFTTAFIAGMLSFISPCVLPLAPGYVAMISGVSVEELQRRKPGMYWNVLLNAFLYGGEGAAFSSLRARGADCANLNLEQGETTTCWGRLIFHVADVDALWRSFKGLGFKAERPRDASWGEEYFHMLDPDGHELSFARPLQ